MLGQPIMRGHDSNNNHPSPLQKSYKLGFIVTADECYPDRGCLGDFIGDAMVGH